MSSKVAEAMNVVMNARAAEVTASPAVPDKPADTTVPAGTTVPTVEGASATTVAKPRLSDRHAELAKRDAEVRRLKNDYEAKLKDIEAKGSTLEAERAKFLKEAGESPISYALAHGVSQQAVLNEVKRLTGQPVAGEPSPEITELRRQVAELTQLTKASDAQIKAREAQNQQASNQMAIQNWLVAADNALKADKYGPVRIAADIEGIEPAVFLAKRYERIFAQSQEHLTADQACDIILADLAPRVNKHIKPGAKTSVEASTRAKTKTITDGATSQQGSQQRRSDREKFDDVKRFVLGLQPRK